MPAETARPPVPSFVSSPWDDFVQALEFAENLQKEVSNTTAKVNQVFGVSVLMFVSALIYLVLTFSLGGRSLQGILTSIVAAIVGAYVGADSRVLAKRLRYDRVVLHKLVQGLHEIVHAAIQSAEFSGLQQELYELRLSRLEFADERKWFRL